MGFVSVIVVVVVVYVFGVVWYMVMVKFWMVVLGVEVGEDGWFVNLKNFMFYIVLIICLIIVVGMMWYMFVLLGIIESGKGLIVGFGVGLFLVVLWFVINYIFVGWL